MKVVAVDHVDRPAQPHHDLLLRPAPGRLPLAGPRPRRATLHCRVELRQLVPAGRGAGPGRHRLVRPGPVLRDVPQGLRAGHDPDGEGPGPAAQPAADLRRVRPADVLPEVRAPAVPGVQGDAPALGTKVTSPAGDGTVVGHNVPSDTVVVRLAESGRRCACSKASVCAPRQAHDAAYSTPAAE